MGCSETKVRNVRGSLTAGGAAGSPATARLAGFLVGVRLRIDRLHGGHVDGGAHVGGGGPSTSTPPAACRRSGTVLPESPLSTARVPAVLPAFLDFSAFCACRPSWLLGLLCLVGLLGLLCLLLGLSLPSVPSGLVGLLCFARLRCGRLGRLVAFFVFLAAACSPLADFAPGRSSPPCPPCRPWPSSSALSADLAGRPSTTSTPAAATAASSLDASRDPAAVGRGLGRLGRFGGLRRLRGLGRLGRARRQRRPASHAAHRAAGREDPARPGHGLPADEPTVVEEPGVLGVELLERVVREHLGADTLRHPQQEGVPPTHRPRRGGHELGVGDRLVEGLALGRVDAMAEGGVDDDDDLGAGKLGLVLADGLVELGQARNGAALGRDVRSVDDDVGGGHVVPVNHPAGGICPTLASPPSSGDRRPP